MSIRPRYILVILCPAVLSTACDVRVLDGGPNVAITLPEVTTAPLRARTRNHAPALPQPSRANPTYTDDVAPLLEKYCLSCHDQATARGGFALEALQKSAMEGENESRWHLVADVLHAGSMPPEGEPRPDATELETINMWLDGTLLVQNHCAARVVVRRLNRAEYDNTIRDLIGIDLRPAQDFPADDIGHGFDNNGEVLSTPPVLLEMYLAAADRVVREAFRSPEIRERIMNPPADHFPRAFRKYTAPARSRPEKGIYVARPRQDPELIEQQRIYDILRAFADRAFRRPALHDELMRLVGIAQAAEKDGETSEEGIQLALRAVLVSPQFLFRLEQLPLEDIPSAAIPPHDFDLASRLAYSLWSSMPDDELFRLASHGELRGSDVLAQQVTRMLRDPKSNALAANFASQWLQTRKLSEITPDRLLFPGFDETLRSAMLEETARFFTSIKTEDRSVFDLLDADYTFVNERLARHYGIAGVKGSSFQRVSLAGTPRGGILTHASVLAATSNPARTSPVKRGKWILENILGAPPAPPPAGVEGLREDHDQQASGTLRQRMEKHRTDPACAACHRRMDPLGFGLENFDAIGAWRSEDEGQAIDASGTLPCGPTFHGPEELRSALAARRDSFTRCFAEKMLTYALGRGLDRADRHDVDRILIKLQQGQYRFSALFLAIVESDAFQQRATESENQ
jgi:hypothetical protein